MIGILDQLEFDAANLAAVQNLVFEGYRPAAEARGMSLAHSWISPPLLLSDAPSTLWVLWEVPDVGAFWNARFRAGADPELPAYWAAIDKLCRRRERHCLTGNKPAADLPQPLSLSELCTTTAVGARLTAQFFMKKDCSASLLQEWRDRLSSLPGKIPGLQRVSLAKNEEGSFGAGDFTFDVQFQDTQSLRNSRKTNYWLTNIQPVHEAVVEREIALEAQLISGGLRQPSIQNAIKRTAVFRLLPSAPAEEVARWERALLNMPGYMAGMTNWSLSRAADNEWIYIWEQEYERLEDLLGEYMLHPHHWSYVDTWFDPEYARQIIDTDLVHAFCRVSEGVLASSLAVK